MQRKARRRHHKHSCFDGFRDQLDKLVIPRDLLAITCGDHQLGLAEWLPWRRCQCEIPIGDIGAIADQHVSGNQRRFGPVPVTVTSSNPYYVDPIGTGEPVTVLWDPSGDFGPEGGRGGVRALNLSGGARAALGLWNVEIGGG